jgi:pre-rRNA-processing protein TSR3
VTSLDILIVHDLREPAKKCSLTPLRGMAGVTFHPLRQGKRVDAGRRIWLHPDGDELTPADAGPGLLLIDCTWKRVATLAKHIDGDLVKRRLPKLVTAYPRKSKRVPDPDPPDGLASVEALYAATVFLGRPHPELLAGYHWSSEFLAANPRLSR